MPKYTNSNSVVVTLKSNRISPKETISTLEYIPAADLPAGVTQDSTDPSFVPVQYSALLTGGSGDSGAIPVPAGLQQYRVTVACGAGAVRVETNGVTTSGKGEVVVAGESVSYQCLNRIINSVKVYYLATGTVAKISIA